jgi:adenine deaminase
MVSRCDLIDVAMGEKPADIIIENGKLVNVHTAEIYPADVAIKGDRIAFVGDVKHAKGKNTKIIDARGKYLTPGLIDAHLHMYHSYMNAKAFVRAIMPHGTTAIADGFYGPGIVSGVKAIKYILEEFKTTPLKVIFLVPIIAYLQNRELGLPPAPESPTLMELMEILDWPECRGIEEPPYLPIVDKDPDFINLFQSTLDRGKVVTGHASGINYRMLNAYLAMGASTDHEAVKCDEAIEKIRLGMRILAREGSQVYNVKEISKAITEHKLDSRLFAFCADLAAPEK